MFTSFQLKVYTKTATSQQKSVQTHNFAIDKYAIACYYAGKVSICSLSEKGG